MNWEEKAMNKVGTVIVAAGYGGHGKSQNPLEKIDHLNIAVQVVVTFQRAGVRDIVIVCKDEKEKLRKELRGFGVTFLQNDNNEARDMFASVKQGISYLESRCERVFVCPVGVAMFSNETVDRLLKNPAPVVIPSFHYRAGHPILINASLIPLILQYQGNGGLRGAIRSLEIDPSYEAVEDKGILIGTDNAEPDNELVQQYKESRMRATVKVRLANRKPFFGPGMVTLLREIDSLGSVREASEKTCISYSKAWTMIRDAESEFGKTLVERQPGGKFGGVASVSEAGKELLEKYEELEQAVEEYTTQKYQEIFRN